VDTHRLTAHAPSWTSILDTHLLSGGLLLRWMSTTGAILESDPGHPLIGPMRRMSASGHWLSAWGRSLPIGGCP